MLLCECFSALAMFPAPFLNRGHLPIPSLSIHTFRLFPEFLQLFQCVPTLQTLFLLLLGTCLFILKSLPARFSFNFLSSICKACDLACLWGLLEGSRPAANSGAFPFFFFYYSLSMMPTHICVLSRVTRWLRICCPISSRRYYLPASPDKDELNLNTKKSFQQ